MGPYMSSPPTSDALPTLLIGPIGIAAESWRLMQIDGIPVDYPAHGARPRMAGWTYRSFAQQIADEVEGAFDVLGVSTGGRIVANLLLHHADRIRSAVVMCTDLGASPAPGAEPIGNGAAGLPRLERDGERERRATVENVLALWFSPYARRGGFPGVQFARESLLKLGPDALEDARAAEKSGALTPEMLRSIRAPVTIVGGMFDQLVGLDASRQLHSLVQNSRHEIMPVSHLVHLEQPEAVNTVLDRHRIWAPVGNRVEKPLGSGVWLHESDIMAGE